MYTDNRLLNTELLKTFIHKKINWIKHDEFLFSPTTYGVVYIKIGNTIYSLTDFYETKNLGDGTEEISVLKIQVDNNALHGMTCDTKKVCENLNLKIQKIILVNTITNITLKSNLNNSDTILDTQGIIFSLDNDYQLAFEKDDFGENISIYKGYKLEDKFADIPNMIKNLYSDQVFVDCKLEFVEI